MNNKCIYYVEGPCEQKLISALKERPEKLIPGKVKVFDVVQNSKQISVRRNQKIVVQC